jgi:hypothetical protein
MERGGIFSRQNQSAHALRNPLSRAPTKLAEERSGVCNFNVAVREWNDQIIFLRKIVPGGADKSYGIKWHASQVCRRKFSIEQKTFYHTLRRPMAPWRSRGKREAKIDKQHERKAQLDLL